jgi:hypothetical protein
MLPEKFLQVLDHEGVVAIATQGADGFPHLVNTWNSYVQVTKDGYLLVPAGGMHRTEKNISKNRAVLLTAGSREVDGKHGLGTGFLISGAGEFLGSGTEFETVKGKFPWARAVLNLTIKDITQTL